LAGLVAGEGCFTVTRALPARADGSVRLRFVFTLTMARRDRALLEQLRDRLGCGSIYDAPPQRDGWQPTSTLTISSRKAHVAATVPFMDEFLLAPTHKRVQYNEWRQTLFADEIEHPRREGRSTCSEHDCERPVRGRGLCRSHYYRATGY
jgi:hypothetical protein